ncbi:Enamine deaminase RidA, house cleaning of reactive enamine intermediates, YjgF/YER057c/UK114 family [Jannaschia faecimaris]|uniref:Enamine deaminase RidA, house cleaning of reactive enamine intermediates, YjgF/YER057c/UK114 family n=1 Tax=Jannaschia faecimaris TaxID=1244108 RepID=A0A1H3MVK5_9RHOB|nr:Rid family hydrolase [Jannaschia faecimaris]SDY80039.1 Enamine deaminase RidA, house cleaning of reactive enamine intermediates, YjgF/YER057c/UK114 family [Jannaschia faecimaris]
MTIDAGGRTRIRSGYAFEDEYGYSRAVRMGGHVWVSGTTARGDDLSLETKAQFAACLRMVEDALKEAGAGFDDVVRSTVYLIDMDDADAVKPLHRKAFQVALPASTIVQVTRLSPSTARVEIEVTAFVG